MSLYLFHVTLSLTRTLDFAVLTFFVALKMLSTEWNNRSTSLTALDHHCCRKKQSQIPLR